MNQFFRQVCELSRERAQRAEQARPHAELLAIAHDMRPAAPLCLDSRGFDLLAEVKLRSPSSGVVNSADDQIVARAIAYASAGAASISVLTEPSFFHGSIEHLVDISRALTPGRIPAMRKDFLFLPYQVTEARVAGAGGILIVLRTLSREETEALLDQALDHHLFVLLETFDEHDIELASSLTQQYRRHFSHSQLMVGVNCRDLTTLQANPDRFEELIRVLPNDVPRVAESGVRCAADTHRLAAAGYDLALVGNALMQVDDPYDLVTEMLCAGRQGKSSSRLTAMIGTDSGHQRPPDRAHLLVPEK